MIFNQKLIRTLIVSLMLFLLFGLMPQIKTTLKNKKMLASLTHQNQSPLVIPSPSKATIQNALTFPGIESEFIKKDALINIRYQNTDLKKLFYLIEKACADYQITLDKIKISPLKNTVEISILS